MPLNETYGKYTPVPHVVIDRCKLSSEIKWTYVQLYHVCWETNGLYSGSYSKLAETLRTTKNKAYRMVKALEAAHMLKTRDDYDKLSLTLNSVSLWILNGLYDIGIDVPHFTDVVTALDTVLKIERKEQEIISIDLDSVLNLVRIGLNLERIVLFLERFGLFLERNVLFLERLKSAIKALDKPSEEVTKKAPIISNSNIPTNSNKNASANRQTDDKSSKIVLNEQEKTFWVLWCKVWFNQDIPPTLNDKAYEHIPKLAPYVTTSEQLNSLIEYARTELAQRGIKQKTIHLGNLVNSYRGWKQSQPVPIRPEDTTHVGPYRRIGKKIS